MYKLFATIKKDWRILTRDKVGLTLMFIMPVLLAIIITAIQNSTFEMVNDNKVPLLVSNKDQGELGRELIRAIDKIGMFDLKQVTAGETEKQVITRMQSKDALIAVVIPPDFSSRIDATAKNISGRALNQFGLKTDSTGSAPVMMDPLTFYYHPVLQQSFRSSVEGALRSALQLVQSRQIVRNLYFSINEKELPADLENDIVNSQVHINEVPVSKDGSKRIPNATEHNIPAWTIFAMFFVVISLGSSVVREKMNGSFTRLKTLPTSYLVALLSKQLTYLLVTMAQTAVIFALGIWLFPRMGLPALTLPADLPALVIVSVICGLCAVSYAICIGVFAQTQEQANGFGAVSIVIMAAIGGLLVPSFAMPHSFNMVMKISPLHWCLEAYYGLFLEAGKLSDVLTNIIPLIIMIVLIQVTAFWGLKRKNLI
jgi:ABC-2 type transport system permease protein